MSANGALHNTKYFCYLHSDRACVRLIETFCFLEKVKNKIRVLGSSQRIKEKE
jgi:hypothetical protein